MVFLLAITLLAILTLTIAILCVIRILAILPQNRPRAPRLQQNARTHSMFVMGSGGHTAEMLLGLRDMDPRRHWQRTWVVSSGDGFSLTKVKEFEESLRERVEMRLRENGQMTTDHEIEQEYGRYMTVVVPRARRVHQPLYTTPISSLKCLWACIQLLRSGPPLHSSVSIPSPPDANISPTPNIILTNGPATAAILILASLILRFLDSGNKTYNTPSRLRTVYFESWARVNKLSLSGKLLEHVVDRFVVQWPQLLGHDGDTNPQTMSKVGKREYRGWLVIDPDSSPTHKFQ